ncbi:bcl-2 homologous antagonist/killer [Hyperolius riggenbachi]|uniref:bcl-2 homologous antagonist/killer n=1 Tax=Hyperolius riggenbachi TaxID=752182 RepID=UPI0035A26A73
MATGGREDTTDYTDDLGASEEQVGQQTETVFLSYAVHLTRFRREGDDEDEDSTLPVNEIEEAVQENSNLDKVGQQLALIGDDLNKRYEEFFNDILKDLNPNLDTAYDYFKKIASSVFETGVNWGRVLALLGFGYQLAVFVWKNGRRQFFRRVAQWLARYLVESSIARWIVRQGGWAAVLKLTNNSIQYVLMALGVVLILQFLIKRISSGS